MQKLPTVPVLQFNSFPTEQRYSFIRCTCWWICVGLCCWWWWWWWCSWAKCEAPANTPFRTSRNGWLQRRFDLLQILKSHSIKQTTGSFVDWSCSLLTLVDPVVNVNSLDLKTLWFFHQVAGTMSTYPSSAAIVAEPLGVTLVISAWNFPFCKFHNSSLPTDPTWNCD